VLLFVLATTVAVVVAPVSEEVFFRLLFQGWLEKWETWRVTQHAISPESTRSLDEESVAIANAGFQMTDDGCGTAIDPEAAANSSCDMRHSSFPSLPLRGLAGLPFGWIAIFLSSLLFAIAHIGHGLDPIPIFFLALILGYVYQRTHRIVPCIVAHMLFNSLAMLVLWQLIFVHAK
jgi:hypothetical protein